MHNYYVFSNIASVSYCTIRVNWTSWAHIYRLRFHFLRQRYDSAQNVGAHQVDLHGHSDCHKSWVSGNVQLGLHWGDVPILDLDHFVHAHIMHDEPNYSISMLYVHKAIRLPNPALQLYSCESLTLQFDRMGEVQDHLALTGELVRR
jgi:hypothetical protein